MHLVDLDQAILAFDRQLKPSGTLAISCMGYPSFEDERIEELWMPMFRTAMDRFWIQPRLNEGDKSKAGLDGNACIANAYDPIPLPTSIFEDGAVRYKINARGDWWYKLHVPPGREEVVPRWNQVGQAEKVVVADEEGWDFEVTVEGMRAQTDTFPVWGDYSEYEGYWANFKEILGEGTVKGRWPYILILATKRS